MIARRLVPLIALAFAAGCGSNAAPAPAAAAPASSSSSTSSAATVEAPAAAAAPVAEPKVPPGWPFEKPVVVEGKNGMVVTDHGTASKVGRDVLSAGGNAADAAVAAAFALAVVFPTAGNIGGGGFAVTRINGQVRSLDFRETAPAAASRNMYLDPQGKPSPRDSLEGPKASGVPGSVAGLYELYQQLGSKKKTWPELLAPAIELAEKGFVVDEAYLRTFGKRPDESPQDRLRKFPSTMSLYFPNGALPAQGSVFKNPELAATLKRIAAKGAAGFYEGPTADAIVAQMKAGNGLITKADLKAYKAKWRTPIEFTYRGNKIISMPPPSSGGVTLAMICHILEGYDLKKLGWQSPEELHLIIEAMRRAFAARNEKLGDPDFVKLPLEQLLSEQWATEQRATIKPDKATPSSEIQSGAPSGMGPHTTHFSVVDGAGNAVALTTTPNFWFGAGVVVKGAGFILNNEMDDFAAVPGTPNGFGLVQGEANAIAPGKRMLSSMSPTVVVGQDGQVKLVAGAAGGPTIITAVFNEISAVIDFGLDPGVAVSGPRFHMQHWPDVVVYEKGGLAPGAQKRLEGMGYSLKEQTRIADAPAIGRAGTSWVGVAEPRREGGLAAGF